MLRSMNARFKKIGETQKVLKTNGGNNRWRKSWLKSWRKSADRLMPLFLVGYVEKNLNQGSVKMDVSLIQIGIETDSWLGMGFSI